MHVLQISWEYPPHIVGGLGRHVADLAPALTEHDVIVTVLTPNYVAGKRLNVIKISPSVVSQFQRSIPTTFPVLSIIPVAILSRQLMRFSLADDLI